MSRQTRKSGRRRGLQRYKCNTCGKRFQNSRRGLTNEKLWGEYAEGKQTYSQLASSYGLTIQAIRNRLDKVTVGYPGVEAREMLVIADTTFFGDLGVTVLRDWYDRQNVFVRFVEKETVQVYREGLEHLRANGAKVLGLVADGKKGVLQAFPELPTQLCQFHQGQTVERYITKRPRLEASKELQAIVGKLTETNQETFTALLFTWHATWETFLKERTENPETGNLVYTHRRLRSAYSSLKRNLPYLFTYQKYPDLNIPNTTNSLEGSFATLKKLVGLHQGLSHNRKMKLIKHLLLHQNSTPKL
jgi:hypothetical protein